MITPPFNAPHTWVYNPGVKQDDLRESLDHICDLIPDTMIDDYRDLDNKFEEINEAYNDLLDAMIGSQANTVVIARICMTWKSYYNSDDPTQTTNDDAITELRSIGHLCGLRGGNYGT